MEKESRKFERERAAADLKQAKLEYSYKSDSLDQARKMARIAERMLADTLRYMRRVESEQTDRLLSEINASVKIQRSLDDAMVKLRKQDVRIKGLEMNLAEKQVELDAKVKVVEVKQAEKTDRVVERNKAWTWKQKFGAVGIGLLCLGVGVVIGKFV